MTPIALTPAARSKKRKPPRRMPSGSTAGHTVQTRKAGHRANLRRTAAASAPRRVSGPARPAQSSRGISAPRPARRPKPRWATTPGREGEPLGARALAFFKALPDHQLLDRIVRGRAWIPLLGMLLAGIVAMQVEVLKLGAGIGRSIEHGTQLQSRNELLSASVASLADDQRIERLAAGMGMVMPGPEAISFLSLRSAGYLQRAASSIHQPDPAAFVASLPAPAASTTSDTGTAVPAGGGSATTTPTSTAPGAAGQGSSATATGG